jgi:hypothetical protein
LIPSLAGISRIGRWLATIAKGVIIVRDHALTLSKWK